MGCGGGQKEAAQKKLLYTKQNMIIFSFRHITRGRVRYRVERKKLSTGRSVSWEVVAKTHPRTRKACTAAVVV